MYSFRIVNQASITCKSKSDDVVMAWVVQAWEWTDLFAMDMNDDCLKSYLVQDGLVKTIVKILNAIKD